MAVLANPIAQALARDMSASSSEENAVLIKNQRKRSLATPVSVILTVGRYEHLAMHSVCRADTWIAVRQLRAHTQTTKPLT